LLADFRQQLCITRWRSPSAGIAPVLAAVVPIVHI
jgi:hypothetical protein